ncbi:MAG: bifunctional phosphoribosyl-AMP cyclohydrolase/phosphoribosyl-ATP diphosphatase HisIE [bacterium]
MSVDLSELKFDSDGLIPVIVQDHSGSDVLMMAYMNIEALRLTLETGFVHFFSRSRRKIWKKGESSGHIQSVKEVLYDCDADTLLVKVDQKIAACHTGRYSCFYRVLGTAGASDRERGEVLFDPDDVYKGARTKEILDRLYGVIIDRKTTPKDNSYTSQLLVGGTEVMGKKILEEGFEFITAAESNKRESVIKEAADLLYHIWVVLGWTSVNPDEVLNELASRFGRSGLEEKASRDERS